MTEKELKIKKSDYGDLGLLKVNNGAKDIVHYLGNVLLDTFPEEVGEHEHGYHHIYGDRFRRLNIFLRFYISLYEYLDCNPEQGEYLKQSFYFLLRPSNISSKKVFEEGLGDLLDLLEDSDIQIMKKLKKLKKIECIRLEEASNCLDFGANLSCVVMAVSAVEYRLHKLLSKKDNVLYQKEFERATLGGIIELFKKDTRYTAPKYDKIKDILPDKHKPLIEMLNIYRIFSAHPKDEKISGKTAEVILSLSFLFLTDPNLQI